MRNDLLQAKATLREQMRARRSGPSASSQWPDAWCDPLKRADVWQRAQAVLFFAPLPDEPNIWPLLNLALAEKKVCALPGYASQLRGYLARRVVDPASDLVIGKFGIRECAVHCPEIPLNHLDLLLVPGVAFDAQGHRLGRGKGFYDRLLAHARGIKCGVAFDEQIVPAVPVGPHDVGLDCILTPTRWIKT